MAASELLLLTVYLYNITHDDVIDYQQNVEKSDPFGIFKCPPNHVLLIDHIEHNPLAIYMRCDIPDICQQKLHCRKHGCSNRRRSSLSFLKEANENMKFEPLEKRCCIYWPRPRKFVKTECFNLYVTDTSIPKEELKREPDSYFGTQDMKEKYDRKQIENDYPKNDIIRDIMRIDNGYKVIACRIICKNKKTKSKFHPPQFIEEKPINVRRRHQSSFLSRTKQTYPQTTTPPFRQYSYTNLRMGTAHFDAPSPSRFRKRKEKLKILSCFSGDNQVETPQGQKRMDQLKTDDQVLVSGIINGRPIYQPIETWYHRISNKTSIFVIITTSDNSTLSLSANHLLPLLDCWSIIDLPSDTYAKFVEHEFKLASKAKPGQCVIKWKNNRFVPQKIIDVREEIKTGIYSPITAQGTMIVNGFYVSCFTTFENQVAQHALHNFAMNLYKLWQKLTGYTSNHSDFVDIPFPLKFIMTFIESVLPENML